MALIARPANQPPSSGTLPSAFDSLHELDSADVRGRGILRFVFGGGDVPVDPAAMHPAWVGGRRELAASGAVGRQPNAPSADAEMLALARRDESFNKEQRKALRRAYDLVDVFSTGMITGREFSVALLTMGIDPDVGDHEILDDESYSFDQFLAVAAGSLYSSLKRTARQEMDAALRHLDERDGCSGSGRSGFATKAGAEMEARMRALDMEG